MKGLIVVSGILALIILVSFTGPNKAYAGCHVKAGCSADDDIGYPVLCESGSYDPCDNWMSWDVYFYRNENWIQTTTRFEVSNSGWHRDYSALVWPEGNHHDHGLVFVGSSSNHKTRIVRTYGTGGAFEDLVLEVKYLADDPTK